MHGRVEAVTNTSRSTGRSVDF